MDVTSWSLLNLLLSSKVIVNYHMRVLLQYYTDYYLLNNFLKLNRTPPIEWPFFDAELDPP